MNCQAVIQWNSHPVPGLSHTIHHVHYANGRWVMAGENGSFYTSANGKDWSPCVVTGDPIGDLDFDGVTYGNGKWLAIGNYITLQSADGITWSQVDHDFNVYVVNLTFEGGFFLASVSHGTLQRTGIWRSSDGNTWAKLISNSSSLPPVLGSNGYAFPRGDLLYRSDDLGSILGPALSTPSGSVNDIMHVGYHNGLYIAGDLYGNMYSSADAWSWWGVASLLPTNHFLSGSVPGSVGFVACTNKRLWPHDQGAIMISSNGVDWELQAANFGSEFNDIATDGHGHFVAVGNGGKVVFGQTLANGIAPTPEGNVIAVYPTSWDQGASAFSSAVDGGNNRKWVNWLGWYNDQYWPWIWDYQHGTWLWVVDNGPENVWMWHNGLQKWMWTRTDWYPWVRFAGDAGLTWRTQ